MLVGAGEVVFCGYDDGIAVVVSNDDALSEEGFALEKLSLGLPDVLADALV